MDRLVSRMRGVAKDDAGSTLPLILGYVMLALALIFVCVNATDLYIAQKRLDAVADAAALAGTEGFTVTVVGGVVRAELNNAGVRGRAQTLVNQVGSGARLVTAFTPDRVSVEATVTDVWHPVLLSAFVPDGLQLTSTARARVAFR